MIKTAWIKPTGEVAHINIPTSDNTHADGSMVDDLLCKHMPLTISNPEYILRKYWNFETSTWEVRSDIPSKYHYWVKYEWLLDQSTLRTKIRSLRQTYLRSCDWTQLLDFPGTASKQAAWAVYRQDVRDILTSHPNPQTIDEIVWPTPPA